jgi:hypothetical protein
MEGLAQFHVKSSTVFNLAGDDSTYIFDMVAPVQDPTLLAVSASNHVVKVYDRETLILVNAHVQANAPEISIYCPRRPNFLNRLLAPGREPPLHSLPRRVRETLGSPHTCRKFRALDSTTSEFLRAF